VIYGYLQVLQPPFASVPGDRCWSVMLDEPFRENQLIVIEPNPVTPDLRRGCSAPQKRGQMVVTDGQR
jgi:hypothetical protein